MNNPFKCKQCDAYHKKAHNHTVKQKADKPKTNEVIATTSNGLQFYTYAGDELLSKSLAEEARIRNLAEVLVQQRLAIADKPVLTECFVGYRVWHYLDGYLRSCVMSDHKWLHRKALSKDVYHNAGIHACKDFKKLLELMGEYPPKPPARLIAGAIYMWGEVEEKTQGYLSEFAYPKELYVNDEADPMMIMQLEEDYGVPVQIRKELNKEFIVRDLSSLWRSAMTYYNYTSQSPWTPIAPIKLTTATAAVQMANNMGKSIRQLVQMQDGITNDQTTQAIIKIDKTQQSI